MRRNYGSLNLAALDLSSAGATADRKHHHDVSLAHELAHLNVHGYDDCASAVGCPIEDFEMMVQSDDEQCAYEDAYAFADAPRYRKRSLSAYGACAESRASSSASITSTCSTVSTCSSSSGISIPVPTASSTAAKSPSSSYQHHKIPKQHSLTIDLPPRLVEQHHMELSALRCLSLNLMLSSSSPSGNGGGIGSKGVVATVPQPSTSVPKMNTFEFEMSCQPQTDRVTAALLAGRRGSLPRNMIQSV